MNKKHVYHFNGGSPIGTVLLLIMCALMGACSPKVRAQAVITINISMPDELSQQEYQLINASHASINGSVASTTAAALGISSVIGHESDELTRVSPVLLALQPRLMNFSSGTSFNATLGYNSYGYIQKKYPIVDIAFPNEIVRNKLIRLRYQKKLSKESIKINQYLNPLNPVPEGERIFLILSAMEEIISITLKDEKF